MSANIVNVSFRIDAGLKKEAEELFQSLGLTLTAAFNVFLRKSIEEQGIPFMVQHKPNKETLEALKEMDEILKDPNRKGHTVEETLEILHNDVDD